MTLEELKRKIESTEDLHSVIKTMKTLAAVNIRQQEKAVEALADYSRAIELGFQVLMKEYPESFFISPEKDKGKVGILVFGSEQGMCGDFNRKIAVYTIDTITKLNITAENLLIMTLGDRAASQFEAMGQRVEERFSIFGCCGDIISMLRDILLSVELWQSEKGVKKILLFHHRMVSGASYEPSMTQLFPIDMEWLLKLGKEKWPSKVLPCFSMKQETLFASLVRQYLFVSLYRAFAESLASENASRLASMYTAEKNVEENLAGLNADFHRERQSTITAEILDIIGGFEALSIK